ncbi:hypothetical protein FSP39_009519 [Pinctada imbricata]|uniref:AAA+ ATPase domain-containing protein n=1 Tax=Pinctada imbricata TaxID=66713 RepID=A0AA88XQZ2_PINIB|nr:hypothetical protein FSP39_009519 [Pinctada imbricata]
MELPEGIAKNTALRENVFVILVCILNKIPIFVVGKPGCSKSLSMQLIRSNLRGKDSKDDFFRILPQLYCVSFQGSESSTSDGIIKVFDKAKKYQEHNSEEDVMSVVILDEIGLAEISRFNPLKVLHSLLEPENKTCPDVAVVGISNWTLDAAKMNRAIHLSRPEMDCEELFETSRSISLSLKEQSRADSGKLTFLINKQQPSFCRLSFGEEEILHGLADGFFQYSKEQTFKNFHGLRDFYSLTKYISKGLLEAGTEAEGQKGGEIVLAWLKEKSWRFADRNVKEKKLDLTDPPFLNRFEKQSFRYVDMLDEHCTSIIAKLNTFVDESCYTQKQFKPSDTYPLYTEDLVPSLVIAEKMKTESDENMFANCCSKLLWISTPDAILRMPYTQAWGKNAMYFRKLQKEYFSLPIHSGLEDLLAYVVEKDKKAFKVDKGLTVDSLDAFCRKMPLLYMK